MSTTKCGMSTIRPECGGVRYLNFLFSSKGILKRNVIPPESLFFEKQEIFKKCKKPQKGFALGNERKTFVWALALFLGATNEGG